jgi:YVTN family beta-propeller protein
VHAYSDADGNYLVPGLPPGTYNIYIQPLDGNVYGYALRPGNISTYIYCNTIYTDYPGEYLSVGESNEESSDTPFEVTVTVNADSPGNNIITNKDLTPPTFKSVKPTDLLDGKIKVMSDFVLRFSEPIDVQTFNGETCYLELPIGKKFGGSYTAVPDSTHIIVFNPDSVLRYNATYTLHLTSGIKDMKGNGLIEPSAVSFTTVDRDHTPPTIASTFPVNTADSVFVTTKINVIFSEAMDIGSVNENFALTWDEGTPVVTRTVDGSFSWDNERRNLTFTPSRSLNEKTKYTITVSTGATDLSDNQLANTNSFTFTTVTEAAPQIFYLGPRNLQTGVTVETPVVADFSEPVDPLSVNSTTFSLKTTNGQIPVTGTFEFLNGNTRVVFRPDVNLEFSTGYTILLTTGIKDVSETVRNLEADRTSVFTTASAIVSPSITYLYPPRGKAGWAVTISGTGFDPIPDKNLISFNGITAYTETASLNTLTTKVPANTLSGSVSVTVNGRTSNLKQFDIIPDYGNDPIDYVVSSKSLGSYPSGGADIGGSGEAVFALVTNPDGNYVTRIGLGTQAGGITTIPVGLYPRNVDIDPQGRRAYVTNSASHDVSVIDLTRNIVVKTIPVGVEPYDVAVMPDGKRVYVSNYVSGNLSMIDEDPTSGGFDHAVANVPMGTDPTGVVGTGDAGMVLVVGEFGLKIVNSDPKNDNYNSVVASVNTGTTYGGVDVTGDAGFAIVYTLDGYLLVINLHPENDDYSGAVVASVKIGSDLSGVKSDANGIYVYLTDTNNNQILVYKFSGGGTGSPSGSSAQGITLMPLAPIPVPYAPVGFAKSQSGDKIYTVTSVSSSPTSFRQVTSVSPSGLKISPESTIEGLISTIQILINNGIIKQAQGNELIKKLNDALKNLANNKTKNAINDLNAFINKVKAQVPKAQGQPIIDATNAIIKQLQGIKSDEEETNFTDIGTQSDQDVITQTKFGVIYPNPSRDAITINYEVAADELNSGKVMIKVYDVIGRVVSNLVNSTQEPGRYSVTWSATSEDGNQVSRGVYFIRLKAGNVEEVRQIMLVR